jgi:hypothetical protein
MEPVKKEGEESSIFSSELNPAVQMKPMSLNFSFNPESMNIKSAGFVPSTKPTIDQDVLNATSFAEPKKLNLNAPLFTPTGPIQLPPATETAAKKKNKNKNKSKTNTDAEKVGEQKPQKKEELKDKVNDASKEKRNKSASKKEKSQTIKEKKPSVPKEKVADSKGDDLKKDDKDSKMRSKSKSKHAHFENEKNKNGAPAEKNARSESKDTRKRQNPRSESKDNRVK